MDNNKINEFLEEIIFGKFIINFIPGLILFYVLKDCIGLSTSTGDGMISFLIVTSVSWTLGLMLEIIILGKPTYKKENKKHLFIAKIAVSTLITSVYFSGIIHLFTGIIGLFISRLRDTEITYLLKLLFFLVSSILLIKQYAKRKK